MKSFGQVISVLGTGVGFPGDWSRTDDTIIVAHVVLTTAALSVKFGDGVVLIPSATGGNYQSLTDYLATAANAQNLERYFAGVAVRNVKTNQPYSNLSQTESTVVTTTMTQVTSGSTTIVVVSATGVAAGQSIEGAGIQANTTVVSVSGTTVTISLATIAPIPALTNVAFFSAASAVLGSYAAGEMSEALVRSSVTVAVTTGTPQAGNPVYVRTVANANLAGTSVGDFEAADDASTTSVTITTTIGSTTLTTSSGTGVAVGQRIEGAGIARNTYIVSGATTSWVLSQAAIATVAGGAATFYNTALFGPINDPWIVFRTGQIDSSQICEITIKNRHAA